MKGLLILIRKELTLDDVETVDQEKTFSNHYVQSSKLSQRYF